MIEFDGPREWRRNDWLDLVEFARPYVASMTIVLRGERDRVSEPARARAEHLATLGAGRWRRSHSWPGTELRGSKATVPPDEAAALERSHGRLRSGLHRVDDRRLR